MNKQFDQHDINSDPKDLSHDDILKAMNKLTMMIEQDKKNMGFQQNPNQIESSPEEVNKFATQLSDEESPDVDYLNEVYLLLN